MVIRLSSTSLVRTLGSEPMFRHKGENTPPPEEFDGGLYDSQRNQLLDSNGNYLIPLE